MITPETRTVITELLRGHRGQFDVLTYSYRCHCGEKWPALPSDHDREVELHEAHQADMLVADPRIAEVHSDTSGVAEEGLDLDAIQARADAATEGPWKYRDIIGENHNVCVNAHNIAACGAGDLDPEYGDRDQQAARNAEFIAHARTDVPALIAAVRERDATIARVRSLLDPDRRGLTTTGTFVLAAYSVIDALDPEEGQ